MSKGTWVLLGFFAAFGYLIMTYAAPELEKTADTMRERNLDVQAYSDDKNLLP